MHDRVTTEPLPKPPPSSDPSPGVRTRFLLFGGLWLVLAGWDPMSWIIGLPTLILATWISTRMPSLPYRPLAPRALLFFIPFFLVQSLRGGLDVTRRVLGPRLRIDPGFQTYRTRLIDPPARVLFFNCISLLPGTLSADVRRDLVQVHALDVGIDLTAELTRLEDRVAGLFGETPGGELGRGEMGRGEMGRGEMGRGERGRV